MHVGRRQDVHRVVRHHVGGALEEAARLVRVAAPIGISAPILQHGCALNEAVQLHARIGKRLLRRNLAAKAVCQHGAQVAVG